MPEAPRSLPFILGNAPTLLEVPVTTVTVLGKTPPVEGGWFRLWLYVFIALGAAPGQSTGSAAGPVLLPSLGNRS